MSIVAIVDYGMGNLDSVKRAFEECGSTPIVTSDASEIRSAERIVLPGVGSFNEGMKHLRARGLDSVIQETVASGIPLLGICLGMQLLASEGEEGSVTLGLGLVPSRVVRLLSNGPDVRVPHVGWNNVNQVQSNPLLSDIAPGKDFYFVHSYHMVCDDESHVVARTPYCGSIVSAINSGGVFGVQFHPEKSQVVGFQLIRNFLRIQC